MSITPFFPTPVYYQLVEDAERINQKLLPALQALKAEASNISRPDIDRWQCDVYTSFFQLPNLFEREEFSFLQSIFLQHLNQYAEELELDMENHQIEIYQSWTNIYQQHQYQETHDHGLSFTSGIYYLKAPEEGAKTVLYSPAKEKMLFPVPFTKKNIFSSNYINIKGSPGGILLFPGWLKHRVSQHQIEEERITISFNTRIRPK